MPGRVNAGAVTVLLPLPNGVRGYGANNRAASPHPRLWRDLSVELCGRPAGIAEGGEAFARTFVEADVAQHPWCDGQCHAAVDIERVCGLVFGAVHHKADARIDRATDE